MRTPHEPVIGTVRDWDNQEGWGVLLTPDGLTVFCHFSVVAADGYRTLTVGSRVRFDYETPGQDGCDARVLTSAQPVE
ncbi:MAG: cold shock protein [Frankiales bacterium]|nr:cold shock protein [Frankiales bacterium]